jgi:ketosteroid isomerase-like protein
VSAETSIQNARDGYAAFSAGDAEAAMRDIADDCVWVVPGSSRVSGTYRGKAEIGKLWAEMGAGGLTVNPRTFTSDGDGSTVVALVDAAAGSESWRSADVMEFDDGKVVRFESIGDPGPIERAFPA